MYTFKKLRVAVVFFLTSNYFWRCPRAEFSLVFHCNQPEVSRVAPVPPSREFAPERQFR